MNDYSYIGVAESISFGYGSGAKFLVRSRGHSIREGNIVELTSGGAVVHAEVLHSAFLPLGCEEEAMLAEFGEIHEVEKIYSLVWKKKEEVTEDGN